MAARVWRAEAQGFADTVNVDVAGNSAASLGSGTPRVMLAGHVDEIGVMITHVDDEGFLYIDGIGGWDPQVLVGQRIRFLTRRGHVLGVMGKKPIHLIKAEEKEKAAKISDLWVDVGARDLAAATAMGLRVGDPGVVDCSLVELGGAGLGDGRADHHPQRSRRFLPAAARDPDGGALYARLLHPPRGDDEGVEER